MGGKCVHFGVEVESTTTTNKITALIEALEEDVPEEQIAERVPPAREHSGACHLWREPGTTQCCKAGWQVSGVVAHFSGNRGPLFRVGWIRHLFTLQGLSRSV